MSFAKLLSRIALLVSLLPVSALAGEGVPEKVEAAIRAQVGPAMAKRAEITDVSTTPIAGIYQVELNGSEKAFVTADGNWLISGNLYQVNGAKGLTNVTEQAREKERARALARLDRAQAIVFPAKGKEKSALFVFTDVDCGYCRKMHQEVQQLNDAGITVNYLAYPRGGMGSETARKMDAVWCAADRGKALTAAKRGDTVPAAPAVCRSPVAEQYRLGGAMGVDGTPAVFTASGEQIGGYIPAKKLAEMLLEQPAK